MHFWGVRGSIPTPMTPEEYKRRLAAMLQQVRPQDLASPQSREKFLQSLPAELYHYSGGNTTCFSVEPQEGDLLVVDGGTGLRELGQHLMKTRKAGYTLHLFFTHFHWDHLQGIPFFAPFFQPQNKIVFYSPVEGFEEVIRGQMREPYFPVPLNIFPAAMEFVTLKEGPLHFGTVRVDWKEVNHPGGCYSYRFEENGRAVIFSTDTELKSSDFLKTPRNKTYFQDAEILILDAQYTLGEAIDKLNWGHTAYSLAVDFALEYGVKTLYLFHHEPNYSDNQLQEIERLAQWYRNHYEGTGQLIIRLAREGLELSL